VGGTTKNDRILNIFQKNSNRAGLFKRVKFVKIDPQAEPIESEQSEADQ
jgi:hypothetical protein